MKGIMVSLLFFIVSGCATLRPVDGTPVELRQSITAGELLQSGDRVRIVTEDAKSHRLTVITVEAGLIVGRNKSVPVDQVKYLEIRQSSKIAFPVSFVFDKEVVVDSLIAIAAFALKPNSINSTP
jgi:hypothetical protein